ncbi:MAG: hypothetical protein DMF98_05030 [Acidobacteria bacterium]|nr:MAG: hypothetical protein DMF98_05030 [Acidobacteriota bacterium]
MRLGTLQGHTNAILALAMTPDGSLLASGAGNADRKINIWSLPAGNVLNALEGHKGGVRAKSSGSARASRPRWRS